MYRPSPNCEPSIFNPASFFEAACFISRMNLLRLRLRSLGLHLRKSLPHPGVASVLGFHCNTWGSIYRIMQISRKEISLELRLLERVLPSHMTNLFGPGFRSHPSYLFIVDAASRLLEASWKEVIAGVTASCRKLNEKQLEPPVLLCNTAISSDTIELLSKGPKFAPDLPTKKVDQLASVHQVAAAIPEPQRQDILGSAIRAVCFHQPPKPGKIPLLAAVEELRQEHLKLLESDKTGVFVVLEEGDFGDKVNAALSKNFLKLKSRPSGTLRSRAKQLCSSLNLSSLKTAISSPAKQYLSVFFTAKTHKTGVPLRSIVSEKGCWQKQLGLFLQKHLSCIHLPQPFRVSNSIELISVISSQHSFSLPHSIFSLDIEGMYFNLDPTTLLASISDAIFEHGAVDFQNSSGVSVSGFVDLTHLYLQSTLVEHERGIYRQKKGVCIGSCLAPVLSELFLLFVDRAIKAQLDISTPGCHVFRYVDDYLIIHPARTSPDSITAVFSACSSGLTFTKEEPSNEGLQYLDLRLHVSATGLCWAFQQMSAKPVLPFSSAHSKSVKHGIIKSLFSSSFTKSCCHLSEDSFKLQHMRLVRAGFPVDLLRSVLERMIRGPDRHSPSTKKKARFAVIPYVHNSAHRIKSIASKFDTNVVFSCRMRLKQLCQQVNNNRIPIGCTVKHEKKFIPCKEKKVYSIPLSCGHQYIGQTGRCTNHRLREHHNEVSKASPDSYHPIVIHARSCLRCHPLFDDTKILGGHDSRFGREIIESFAMTTAKNNVSNPSLLLTKTEVEFLKSE
ncbi:uncharacterized protein LOC120848078, partial [Ixodes scapularis]|uniref:uncharacterized protein LOC120848078 n=1 Tax=Ixodes scapularis TaxID=6945 RepID=UPI001A9FC809